MSSILFSTADQIAFITLNRPEKFNAFNREMALALQETLDACKSAEIRCVVLTGAGKAFCAGQDLAEVVDPEGPGMARILSEHFNPIVMRIRELEKPVLAAVNGVAAGAGANLAICCDIVIATESASFIQAFSKIGLVPDTGGSFFLPRLVGWQKASAWMMLGDKISAAEAERTGMIYRWTEDRAFPETIQQTAATLSAMPTKALYLIKKELQWSATHTMYEQLQNEDKLQQRAAVTEDFKEGVQAFLEKRKPVFRGK